MADPHDSARLKALETRIAKLKGDAPVQHTSDTHYEQAHMGWRMVIEMVAGVLIGFGIGYGLDALFGTIPIFLVLFTLLGFVAGVRVMLRTAQEAQRQTPDTPGNDDERT